MQLFDSIMRGYPISSFSFWELKPENRDKWQAYEFLEKAQYGGTHNELACTDGVTNLSIVLDGQQRLTSLTIGLKGTYTIKLRNTNVGIIVMLVVRSDCTWTSWLILALTAMAQTGIYYKFVYHGRSSRPRC